MRLEPLYRATFTTPEAWSAELAGPAGTEGQSFLIAEGHCEGRLSGRLIGGEEVRREAVQQPGCVDGAGERDAARRVAVDAPGQAIGFEALEDGLGGVVNREGIGGGHVDDVAR